MFIIVTYYKVAKNEDMLDQIDREEEKEISVKQTDTLQVKNKGRVMSMMPNSSGSNNGLAFNANLGKKDNKETNKKSA